MLRPERLLRRGALLLGAFLLLSHLPAVHAAALTLHVSPEGNDAWSGRLPVPSPSQTDGPLASLTGARNAIRQARQRSEVDGPVRVVVADGAFQIAEPLILEPADGGTADAPVRYEAAPGAKPVFSGGRVIAGWRARDDGLWEAHISSVATGEWYFEQLWVNDHRATRARSPNEFYHYFQNVRERALDGSTGRPKEAELTLEVAPAVAAELAGLSPAELHDVNLLAFHKWDNTRRRIDAMDAANARLITRGGGMKPWNPLVRGTPFYLENFRAALDAPGEWFLARGGTLLYQPLPGERLEACEFIAPVADRFVLFAGDPDQGRFVEHITLKGLAFRHGQWLTPAGGFEPAQAAAPIEAAIMADGVRHVAIEDCEISHVGIYGVWFRRGCRDSRLERCLIEDLGAGGVRIGEAGIPPEAARTGRITVANNIIRGGGRVFPCAVGLWIGQSGDNQILHNDVGDMLYTGISVGWRWGYGESLAKRNTIAFNHVHHIGQGVLSDLGGIYTLGPSEGTVVRNNVFHDIHSWSYGGWGLYTDEGSTGILFENNLVYGTKTGGFHQHYGRENIVRNNILAFATQHQLQATRVEDHLSFTFERNIVIWDEGALLSGPWTRVRTEMRDNCYWQMDGEPPRFGQQTFAEWQAAGHDQGAVVTDPMFVNARGGDFRLRPDSPALKLGFVPFDPSDAGVQGDDGWRRQAREYPWPELQLPPPRRL